MWVLLLLFVALPPCQPAQPACQQPAAYPKLKSATVRGDGRGGGQLVPLRCGSGYYVSARSAAATCGGNGSAPALQLAALSRRRQRSLCRLPHRSECWLSLHALCSLRRCCHGHSVRVRYFCYRRRRRYQLCGQNLTLVQPESLIQSATGSDSWRHLRCSGLLLLPPTASHLALAVTLLEIELKASVVTDGSHFRLFAGAAGSRRPLLLLSDSDWLRQYRSIGRAVYISNASQLDVQFQFAEPGVHYNPYLLLVQRACPLPRWAAKQLSIATICYSATGVTTMRLLMSSGAVVPYQCDAGGQPVGRLSRCVHTAAGGDGVANCTQAGGGGVTVAAGGAGSDVSTSVLLPAIWIVVALAACALAALLAASVAGCLLLKSRYRQRDKKLRRQSVVMETMLAEQQWQLERLQDSVSQMRAAACSSPRSLASSSATTALAAGRRHSCCRYSQLPAQALLLLLLLHKPDE